MRLALRCLCLLVLLGVGAPGQAAGPAAGPPPQRALLRPAPLRVGPALYHAVLEDLPEGLEVSVLLDGQRWVRVRTDAGREGWLSARAFLAPPPPSGYGALLGKPGLPGVSAPVVTMASRALAPEGPDALAAWMLELGLEAGVPAAADVERFEAPQEEDARCAPAAGWPEDHPGGQAGERRLGLLLGVRWLGGARLLTAPAAARYLGALGLAVAGRSPRYDLGWSFGLVEDPAPRAVGLPGGLVLVSTGLVRGLPDEAALAALLGREIARVCRAEGAGALATRLAGPPPVPAERALDEAARVLLGPPPPSEGAAVADLGARWAACAGLGPERGATPAARARFLAFLEALPR